MRGLLGKVTAIVILVMLLLALLSMILGIIKERELYQAEATLKVADSTGKAQTLIGPILVVPYKVYKEIKVDNDALAMSGNEFSQAVIPPREMEEKYRFFAPQETLVDGSINVNARTLGIYQTQVYSTELKWHGDFGALDFKSIEQQAEFAEFGEPYLAVFVTDTQGITKASNLTLNTNTYSFKGGGGKYKLGAGIYVPLSIDALQQKSSNPFSFDLQVHGTKALSVVPIGGKSDFKLTGNWPHPSFIGDTLPQTREVSSKGFSAHWQSTWFANNLSDLFVDNQVPSLKKLSASSFNVSMVEPVNQYQLNERTVKYGILFIGLTFIAFLIIELLSQLRIHPIQYTLVGGALVIFYLLLLALSEHIGFNLAYVVAAAGCSGLIGLYLCSVLKSKMRGGIFTGGLVGLYALLFIILQSEDQALLLGSGLLFVILSAIMLTTRKVDWYALTDKMELKKAKTEQER